MTGGWMTIEGYYDGILSGYYQPHSQDAVYYFCLGDHDMYPGPDGQGYRCFDFWKVDHAIISDNYTMYPRYEADGLVFENELFELAQLDQPPASAVHPDPYLSDRWVGTRNDRRSHAH